MTCQHTTEQLLDWLEGELAPDQAAAVEKHLSQCPACRAEVAQLRQVLAAVGHPAEDPGETYFASFYPRLRERLEQETIPWPQRIWRWLAFPNHALRNAAALAAVGLLVLAGLITTGVLPLNGQPDPSSLIASPQASPELATRTLLARVDPSLEVAVNEMEGEEIADLQVRFAKMLVGRLTTAKVVALPGSTIGAPVASSNSVADLNEAELIEVAEALSQDIKHWTL